MKLLKFITDKDICGIDKRSDASPRIAVRAVLLDDNGHIALMFMTKYGFYTVPGGGVEEDEDLETALKREIKEETGCECEILQELGCVSENRAANDFTQISNYYLAKVVGDKGLPAFTQEEKDEDTQVEWYPLNTAYNLITNPKHENYQRKYIQFRDRIVLREAIKYINENQTK
jgi:8-oxo-dGTP diphosphatase